MAIEHKSKLAWAESIKHKLCFKDYEEKKNVKYLIIFYIDYIWYILWENKIYD